MNGWVVWTFYRKHRIKIQSCHLLSLRALTNGELLPTNTAPGLHQAFIHEGLLYCKFCQFSTSPTKAQLVIADSMNNTVLQQLHDQAGHLGISKTTENAKAHCCWPGYCNI